jgi:hypothetical protein
MTPECRHIKTPGRKCRSQAPKTSRKTKINRDNNYWRDEPPQLDTLVIETK